MIGYNPSKLTGPELVAICDKRLKIELGSPSTNQNSTKGAMMLTHTDESKSALIEKEDGKSVDAKTIQSFLSCDAEEKTPSPPSARNLPGLFGATAQEPESTSNPSEAAKPKNQL